MALTEAQLRELSSLIDVMQDLPTAEQAHWLTQLPAEQSVYHASLAQLLHDESQDPVANPWLTLPKLDALDRARPAELSTGDEIGPYRLQRELGVGGMGTVWLAERSDGVLKRPVALKLPHSALPQRQLAERFARERDILAGLTHPHIARLYDAGISAQGQPYLALEYVEGEPLLVYSDRNRLSLRERIELYLQVLEAVHYAHTQLVVHRDLKPSNILVTHLAQVRLLDFGIAKLLIDGQAKETELTHLGGRALTPQYASPEQISGQSIGTASDVYTLGVVLYELLCGTLPYRLKRDSRGALEDAIMGSEVTRPSQMAIDQQLASNRGSTMPKLCKELQGDLDTILLKALKKETEERYATVDAFAADLRRHLAGEAVLARPDSGWYRASRFAQRYRWELGAAAMVLFAFVLDLGVGATAVAMFALAIGLIAALWQAGEARRQARNATAAASRAQDEARTARAVQDFLLALFNTNSSTQSDPLKAQQMTARELLDRGAASVEEALQDAPMSRLEVLDTLANMYAQLGLEQRAADLQQRRVELARRTFGGKDARLAEVLLAYTETLQDGAQRNTIPSLLDEAQTVLDSTTESSTETYVNLLLAKARYWRYQSLLKARQSASEVVNFLQAHDPLSNALVSAHILAARAQSNGYDFDAALKSCEQAIACASLQGEGAKAWLITPIFTLADVLLGQMQYAQCEQRLREAHGLVIQVQGEDHPEALLAKTRLGNLLISLGDIEQGEVLHETVRAALRGTDPRLDSPMRSYLTGLLGSLYMERGRPDLMEPLLQDEIKDLLQTLPGSALLAQRLRQLAEVQAALGDQHSAHSTMATALTRWQAFSADAGPTAVDAAFELSQARLAMASGDAVRALTLLDATRSTSPINAIERDVERAGAQLMQGQAQAAFTCANTALLALSALPGCSKPVVLQANSLMMQGRALLATEHSDQAKAALESALALRRSHDLPQSLWCEQVASALTNANSSR